MNCAIVGSMKIRLSMWLPCIVGLVPLHVASMHCGTCASTCDCHALGDLCLYMWLPCIVGLVPLHVTAMHCGTCASTCGCHALWDLCLYMWLPCIVGLVPLHMAAMHCGTCASTYGCHALWDLCLYSLSGKTSYPKISRSLELWDSGLHFLIALKSDKHFDSSAAEMPVKFQSDMIIIACNFAASRLGGKMCYCLVNRDPELQRGH